MALIDCPECGKLVSTAAAACPGCGYPIAQKSDGATAQEPQPHSTELLAEVHVSWWAFFWHWVFFFLIIPPLAAWWQRSSVVLRVYPGRLMLERGMIAKCYREFLARDIRSIDIDQSFLSRIVGIGDLTISTAATVDASEHIKGIPDPHRIRDLILQQRGSR